MLVPTRRRSVGQESAHSALSCSDRRESDGTADRLHLQAVGAVLSGKHLDSVIGDVNLSLTNSANSCSPGLSDIKNQGTVGLSAGGNKDMFAASGIAEAYLYNSMPSETMSLSNPSVTRAPMLMSLPDPNGSISSSRPSPE